MRCGWWLRSVESGAHGQAGPRSPATQPARRLRRDTARGGANAGQFRAGRPASAPAPAAGARRFWFDGERGRSWRREPRAWSLPPLPPRFRLVLLHAEPLHVARSSAPLAQRHAVIDPVAGARAGGLAGRRAGIVAPKVALGLLAALDAAGAVALASSARGGTAPGVAGGAGGSRRRRPRSLRARPPGTEARRERQAENASGLQPYPSRRRDARIAWTRWFTCASRSWHSWQATRCSSMGAARSSGAAVQHVAFEVVVDVAHPRQYTATRAARRNAGYPDLLRRARGGGGRKGAGHSERVTRSGVTGKRLFHFHKSNSTVVP